MELRPRDIEILQLIARHSIPSLAWNAYEGTVSRATFYRVTRKLEENGFIRQINGGTPKLFELTERGKTVLEQLNLSVENESNEERDGKYLLRAHRLSFRVPLARPLPEAHRWSQHLGWLQKIDGRLRNVTYLEGTLNGARVQVFRQSVMVYLPEIYGWTIEEVREKGFMIIDEILSELRGLLPGIEFGHPELRRLMQVRTREIAIQHHPLAQVAHRLGVSIRGERWEIDHSKDIPELEAIDSNLCDEDVQNEVEDIHFRAQTGIYYRQLVRIVQSLRQELVVVKAELRQLREEREQFDADYIIEEIVSRISGHFQVVQVSQVMIQDQLTDLQQQSLVREEELLERIQALESRILNLEQLLRQYLLQQPINQEEQVQQQEGEIIYPARREDESKFDYFVRFLRANAGREFTSEELTMLLSIDNINYQRAEISMYISRVRKSRLRGFRIRKERVEGRRWHYVIRFVG